MQQGLCQAPQEGLAKGLSLSYVWTSAIGFDREVKMYQLHIANKNYSSWSLRPWVLMKTLGIEFEERLSPFEAEDNFDRFRAFSPTGRVPCLIDDHLVIWDSLGIVEYLADTHPWVWPADHEARAFARCAAAEMHSGFDALRSTCPMNCAIKVAMHSTSPALQKNIDRLDELWCEGLRRFGGPFLAGSQFTAVDAFYCPVAFRVRSYQLPLSAPAADYAARLIDLDAMRAWDRAAIGETWKEQGHEAEAAEAGKIIEDRRTATAFS